MWYLQAILNYFAYSWLLRQVRQMHMEADVQACSKAPSTWHRLATLRHYCRRIYQFLFAKFHCTTTSTQMAWPYLRRLLLPLAALYFCYILVSRPYRVPGDSPLATPQLPLRIPIAPIVGPFYNSSRHPSDTTSLGEGTTTGTRLSAQPRRPLPKALLHLTRCPRVANRFTNHIRLPNILYNISISPASAKVEDRRTFWNPTILALPYWAKNQYIVMSMLAPDGEAYRRNVLCEANICHPKSALSTIPRQKRCTKDDLRLLGPNGGLRCVTPPREIYVPPTPAEKCEDMELALAEIPGFQDPKLFYSGRGEPILMVVSQSRYACIGLWAIDLRTVYPAIEETFSSSPRRLGSGPVKSYPSLTELTRNPAWSRNSYEKNWVMFSTSPSTTYVQYDLNSTIRTFAQLIGGGLTTRNLTDSSEQPCLFEPSYEDLRMGHFMAGASWHQATPSLRLLLCNRTDQVCIRDSPQMVFFAAIQQKHIDAYSLPVRYERYFVIWSAAEPFNMLAVSQHPLLFSNETNRGWSKEQIWDDNGAGPGPHRDEWGRFTYTTTIAYAWAREESDTREKYTGYLDDEVIVSIGIDDAGALYGRAKVYDLLQCVRICPGR